MRDRPRRVRRAGEAGIRRAGLPAAGAEKTVVMAEKGTIRVEGVVKEALPNAIFQVELGDGRVLKAHASTKLRMHCLRILPGDRVEMEVFSRDWSRARIVRQEGR